MKSNREKIIDVAIDLINKKSYHGTSMQMIANKVGITKSTIFHHFENKEAILLAILDLALPSAMYKLKEIVNDENMTGQEKLRKFIELHINVVSKQGAILSIFLREEVSLTEQNTKIHNESRKQYAILVREIVRQVQREGPNRFTGLSSSVVANTILGICNWSIRWYRKDGGMDIDEVCKQLYQIVDPR